MFGKRCLMIFQSSLWVGVDELRSVDFGEAGLIEMEPGGIQRGLQGLLPRYSSGRMFGRNLSYLLASITLVRKFASSAYWQKRRPLVDFIGNRFKHLNSYNTNFRWAFIAICMVYLFLFSKKRQDNVHDNFRSLRISELNYLKRPGFCRNLRLNDWKNG
jgi:hypothetical protein